MGFALNGGTPYYNVMSQAHQCTIQNITYRSHSRANPESIGETIIIHIRGSELVVDEMMDVSKLNGVKVIAADSFTLGEVDGANVDTKQWRITHLKVGLSDDATRELGFNKPLLGSIKICVPVETISGYGDVVTLKKSLMELKGSDECRAKRR